MSPESFAGELSAQLIESSQYNEYPEGTLGAIEYLSKQDLSKLKTNIGKSVLERELEIMRWAEDTIINGFRDFLSDGGVRITLTQEEKTKNISFLIEPISYLFALRNKHNPTELRKLDILQNKKNTPGYILSLDFKQNPKIKTYFIKNIQILPAEKEIIE